MAPLLVVLARQPSLTSLNMGGEDDFESNWLSESQAQRIRESALSANPDCELTGYDFEEYGLH